MSARPRRHARRRRQTRITHVQEEGWSGKIRAAHLECLSDQDEGFLRWCDALHLLDAAVMARREPNANTPR